MNYRRLISFFLILSFFILTFSGVVLYIMPHGRVAYWTDWRLAGLNKDNWAAIHTIYSIIFVIGSSIHIIFNWKPIKIYINKNRKELLTSLIVSMFLFTGILSDLAPFKTVMETGEFIKSSWEDNKIAPKIPHGELLPLKKLCKRLDVNIKIAVARLKENRINITSKNERILDIAKRNNLKPIDVYLVIKNKKTRKE